MKQKLTTLMLPALWLGLVLGCGLSSRNGGAGDAAGGANANRQIIVGNSSVANIGKSAPSGEVLEKSDHPETAPETQVENGRKYVWADGGVSVVVPKNWEKRQESAGGFMWLMPATPPYGGEPSLNVGVMVSPRGDEVPADALESDYEFLLTQQKDGKVKNLKFLVIDGVKGVYSEPSEGTESFDERGITWKSLRTRDGKRQLLLFNLRTTQKRYEQVKSDLEKVLYSIKFLQ